MYKVLEERFLPSDALEEVTIGTVDVAGDLNIPENFLEFAIDFINLGFIEDEDDMSLEVKQLNKTDYSITVHLGEDKKRKFLIKKA